LKELSGEEFLELVKDYQIKNYVDVFGELIEENGEYQIEIDENFYTMFCEKYKDYDFERCVNNMIGVLLNQMENK